MMKRYGARGALSDPPQLGESVVVLAWEAEAAVAEAEQRGRAAASGTYWDRSEVDAAVEQARADERARIRAAITHAGNCGSHFGSFCTCPSSSVLAVIDANSKGAREVVLAADHERALAEAVEAERERAHATFMRHYGHDTEKLSSAPAPVPSGGNDGRERQPRVLNADDPEPALRSIVTDLIGDAWQSYLSEGGSVVWASTSEEEFLWVDLLALGPITLIHDAGGE